MHRILIIDDSEFDRRMMALAMKSTGLNLEYIELNNGSDALCDHNQAKSLQASGYYMKPHTRRDYKKIARGISETFLEQAA